MPRKIETIEVIFATAEPIRRQCPVSGWRTESLAMDGCDLSRLRAGTAAFLAGHRTGLEHHLGTVVHAWIADDEARAVIRLSRRAAVRPLVEAILAGDLNAVSVGYAATGVERAGGTRDYVITGWTPIELSLAAVGADSRCRVLR